VPLTRQPEISLPYSIGHDRSGFEHDLFCETFDE